ncbi:hypothetical protein [Croceibacterium ferulae]|uniref:hypothetical protein n=1 Tax=Croceibacterium ferulae TaxID=1854641 RepID=UPI000F86C5F7|nr:hypothetical protein [Croceibacterium ferulae]
MTVNTKVPVSALDTDSIVNLKGDSIADPEGDNALFAEPCVVFETHAGDYMTRWDVKYAIGPSDSFYEENPHMLRDEGLTVIFWENDLNSPLISIFFPNPDHEVTICPDLEVERNIRLDLGYV